MQLKKLSQKQKLYLLVIGLVVIFVLWMSGKLVKKEELHLEEMPIANEELFIFGTGETIEGLSVQEVYTDRGIYHFEGDMDFTPYLYQSIQAVTEGQEILHINNLLQREVRLENCLITENNSDQMCVFTEGFFIWLPCKNLQVQFQNEIADIYIANGSITKISKKKEFVSGKILSIRPEGIELEKYGIVPVSENFRFYKTYGDYEEKTTYELVVGYEPAKLIVAEGEICAAVQEKPISLEKIRVLLKTTDFAEMIHKEITVKAQGDYEIFYGGHRELLKTGEELQLNPQSDYLTENRVILIPQNDTSRLEITSIQRNYGSPIYAGQIEIMKESGGLMLINEVDLETYLYGVVPSEMPASYELEALKAQAVCARSYAYRQILLNGYAMYGAHVDDSVSYQVYNNLPTDEKVIKAVDETAGKVLKFGDEVAVTYYFSTSCGYTTNETIWENGTRENSYISGKLLNDTKKKLDLTTEEKFREFILNETEMTYDSGESWYRWEITVPLEQITENICSIENIGKIKNIQVTERNEGGVVQNVLLTGEKGTLELKHEHAIRVALNGKGQKIRRVYGKDAEGGNMLPSGFFVVDRVEEQGELKGFCFRGGGFGHGAGMSQNGANHMAEAGKSCEEILALFYEGTILSNI